MAQTDATITKYQPSAFTDKEFVSITHFETVILLVNHTDKAVLACAGWSATDRNIINMFFDICDYDNYRATIKQGNLFVLKDEVPIEFAQTSIFLGSCSSVKTEKFLTFRKRGAFK